MSLAQRLSTPLVNIRPREVTIPLGSWRPDLGSYPGDHLTAASGIYRLNQKDYAPLPKHNIASNALDAYPRGAFSVRDTSAAVYQYAGDAAKLYSLSGTIWSDVSVSGGYSTAAGESWEFTRFYNKIVATNYTDAVQSLTIGGAAFAAMMTSTLKPKARHCATIRDFVVLGNTVDGTDGTVPNRVWWSALGDEADFDPDAATLSDFQNIPDAGAVQKIVGGAQYGLVFCEDMIYRMTYAGPPTIFDFYPVDRTHGAPIPNSVIGHGQRVFWITDEGFFATSGDEAVPIGIDRVDRTFWNQIDHTNLNRVSAAIDSRRNLAVWCFPSQATVSGTPDMLYLYHWPTGDFTEIVDNLGLVFSALDPATNIEILGAFDDTNRFGRFDAESSYGATLDTADFKPNSSGRSRIIKTRPHVTGRFDAATADTLVTLGGDTLVTLGGDTLVTLAGGITCVLASRGRLSEAVSWGTGGDMSSTGECSVLSDGEYHRLRLTIAEGTSWTSASAVEIETIQTGRV